MSKLTLNMRISKYHAQLPKYQRRKTDIKKLIQPKNSGKENKRSIEKTKTGETESIKKKHNLVEIIRNIPVILTLING